MKVTAVHLGLFYLLLCEGSTLADMAKRRGELECNKDNEREGLSVLIY